MASSSPTTSTPTTTDKARAGDRRGMVVYVDTVSMEWALGLSVYASMRDLDTALVCSPGQAPAMHRFARVIETDDFSVPALEAVCEELERTWSIRGVTTGFGGFRREGYVRETVAHLAERRGLPTSPRETLYWAGNKFLARDRLAACGLDVGGFGLAPDGEAAVACARRIGLPVVLKPMTGVGSSLILRCNTEREVLDRFNEGMRLLDVGYYPQLRMARHSAVLAGGDQVTLDPTSTLLVEEYFEGREASVECLVVNDEVIPLVVHDKVSIDEREHVVFENVLVAPPERFSEGEVQELTEYATQAVRALGYRWCFCHVELRYVDGVGPRLLEVNPRIGAGCVTDSIETFWGFDVAAMQLSLVLGDARAPRRSPRSTERHAMAFLFSPRSGVLRRFDGLDRVRRLPEVLAVRAGNRPGDVVGGDYEEVFLASVWMRAPHAAAAMTTYRTILDMVDIEVEPTR